MKNYFIYILSALAVVTLLLVASCEEDDDTSAGGNVDITALTFDTTYPGDEVTITGSGLEEVRFIFVGEKQAEFTLESGVITFVIPEDAIIGSNVVTIAATNNNRVKESLTVALTPIPEILAFDAFVPVGGEMTITGTSFDAEYNLVVTIGDVEAAITSQSPTELVVTVPAVPDNEALEVKIVSVHGEYVEPTAFIAQENLLANSQLTAGSGDDFNSWEKLGGGDLMVELSGEAAYGGKRSIHISPSSGNPWSIQLASAPVQLEMDAEYTVVFWAKGDDAGAEMRISASQWDGNGADYFYSHENDEIGFELSEVAWLPHAVTFTVGKDLPEHKVVFDMGKGSVPFAIDHMALFKGVIPIGGGQSPDIIADANNSFEDGLTGWEVLNGTIDVTTDDAYCGTSALIATGAGANPWDTQITLNADIAPTLEVGKNYELGFWAKSNTVTGTDGEADAVMRASVTRWCSGCNDDFFYTPNQKITDEWAYYGFVFEAAATTTGVHQVVFDFGESTHEFLLDAVSLREYDVPLNIYTNTDFEDGITGWEVTNGTVEASTDAYDGEGSLTAVGAGANPWDTQVGVTAEAAPTLVEGKQYKLEFWAKSTLSADEGDEALMRASVTRWCSGCNDDFYYTPNQNVPNEWTYFSFVFEAKTTTTGVHQVMLDFGETTHTFWVDNLNVSEYVTPCD